MVSLNNLSERIRDFTERWDQLGVETDSSYSLSIDPATFDQVTEVMDDIDRFAEIFDPGVLVLQLDGIDDGYRIRYDPQTPQVTSERTDGEYEIESQYSHNDELVARLNDMESDSISDSTELRSTLELISDEGSMDLSFQYNLQKDNIIRKIDEELLTEGLTIRFHFSRDHFSTKIEEMPPRNIMGYLLEDGDIKSLIVISQYGSFVAGQNLAVSGLEELDSDSSFFELSATWQSELESVRNQTMIENIESNFIPPSYFRFDTDSDDQAVGHIRQLFSKFIVLFSILSVMNSAEQVESGNWRVRMTGRQYLEGVISFVDGSGFTVLTDGDDHQIDVSQEFAENLYSIYEWIYLLGEPENRIVVFQNVATLYARSIEDFLSNITKILSSAKANRQYFLEQSIDDFFEFRQELMEGAFRTQKSFSELRSELMQDFTRDLFRTFGFILILSLTIFFQLDTTLPIDLVYNLIATLVLVYGVITLRRIGGIRRNFSTVIENRNNFVKFYSRFLEENELEEIGIGQSDDVSWLCRRLISGEEDYEGVQGRCEFIIDFTLYYLLAIAVIIGSILIYIDINWFDIIPQIPPG